MEERGYPRLAEHRALHRQFSITLFDLRITNVQRDNVSEIVAFVKQWLVDHIATADMEFVSYLKQDST